jgi:uncharacterized membrane protein YozB (DUF420 family)
MDLLNYDSFLGSRASLMMDVVFIAMFAVMPVLGWSLFQAKYRRRYRLHQWIQVGLGVAIAVAVTLFEVHVRIHGWQSRAGDYRALAWVLLVIHLCFSVPTAFLWVFVIVRALRKMPKPPGPSPYSRRHRFWGRLALYGMLFTAITGWMFYVAAFVM